MMLKILQSILPILLGLLLFRGIMERVAQSGQGMQAVNRIRWPIRRRTNALRLIFLRLSAAA